MSSPKYQTRGEKFIPFDYIAALENGFFKVALLIDDVPKDLKITYRLAICNPWRPVDCLKDSARLNASFGIKSPGLYHLTVVLCSQGKTFAFDTPTYGHQLDKTDENWPAKCAELKKNVDFVRPLELFRIAHPDIQLIVHNAPAFPATGRTKHEQQIWDNLGGYADAAVIQAALHENPPRLISRAWDEFSYGNTKDIAGFFLNRANFHTDEYGVFTVSDNTSQLVNTLAGHRITYNQPENSERTIWHIGYCRVFGNGAPDWGTIDSFLQGILNEKIPAEKIRVENFGYNNMWIQPDQPMKIVRSLEPQMQSGDIVIIDSLVGFPKVTGVLHCDISQVLQRPHPYGECFFDRSHLTENGNRAIAKKLFDFIQENNVLGAQTNERIGMNVAGGVLGTPCCQAKNTRSCKRIFQK